MTPPKVGEVVFPMIHRAELVINPRSPPCSPWGRRPAATPSRSIELESRPSLPINTRRLGNSAPKAEPTRKARPESISLPATPLIPLVPKSLGAFTILLTPPSILVEDNRVRRHQ